MNGKEESKEESKEEEKKLVVGVDQDEVLACWVKRIVQWYNEDKRIEAEQLLQEWNDLSENDVTSWNIHLNLGHGSEPYVRSYMRSTIFYSDLDPIHGAVENFQKLLDDKRFDVMIVTAVPRCSPQAYDGKMKWIRKHFPTFNMDNFLAVKRKDMLSLDVLIDDGLHNIISASKKGQIPIAFSRPWNASWEGLRTDNWYDIPEILSSIYNKKFNSK